MHVHSLFDLTGKWAVVTGCSKGLGASMCIALAEAGADIIGVSSSGHAEEVREAVEHTGKKFRYIRSDLSSRKQTYAFVQQLREDGQRIDILVNNAGIIRRAPAAAHNDDLWDTVIETNLTAPFILARELGNLMIAQGGGKIIFICSLLSFQGGIHVPGYTASKSGVAGLVKALSNEWAGKNMCVNGIAPGYVATDNTRALQDDPERSQAIVQRIPAGRWGSPEDFKGVIVFLTSTASDYMTGSLVTVDGGWMAR